MLAFVFCIFSTYGCTYTNFNIFSDVTGATYPKPKFVDDFRQLAQGFSYLIFFYTYPRSITTQTIAAVCMYYLHPFHSISSHSKTRGYILVQTAF